MLNRLFERARHVSRLGTAAAIFCVLALSSVHAGTRGQYFNGIDLLGVPVERFDNNIDFNWGAGPPVAGIGADNFSVRWFTQVTPPANAPYTFCVNADDGVRLWVNGELLVNDWVDTPAKERCGTITLTGRQTYSLQLEYFERFGQASVQLLWSAPNLAKQVIPASVLGCCSDRSGISGRLFNGRDPAATNALIVGGRQINYNWGRGAARDGFAADNFGISWSGIASPKQGGEYTFYVTADDGVRLRINGQTIIDAWKDQAATTYSGKVTLEAGRDFSIQLDYYENGGDAVIKLEWEAANQTREVIPMGAFFAQFGIGAPLNDTRVSDSPAPPPPPPPVATTKTWYVATNGSDTNNGSQSAPFASVKRALDVVSPGERVEIAAGNYSITQPLRINGKQGTAQKPIVVEGKGRPVLRWNAGVIGSFDGVVTVADSSHVTVRGLRIENSGLFGILSADSSHTTLENNVIDTSIASGIAYFGGSNAIVRGNDLSRFCDRGQRGTPYNCQEGLTISDIDVFDVDGNVVHDALQLNAQGGQQREPGGGEGIDVKGSSRNGKVRNNRVYNLNQLGIYVDGYAKTVENVQVFNNIVHNTSAGIVIAAETSTGGVRNVDVFNNLVYNNGLDGIAISGTYVGDVPGGQPGLRENIRIFHNTVVGNGYAAFKPAWASGDYGFGIHVDSNSIRNILIANNVVEDNSLSQIAANDSVNRAQMTIDRNLMYPLGKTGAREIAGSNGITASAQFADAANKNFRLGAQSPAIAASSAASPRPANDLDGKSRAGMGGLELGAYAR
jgi:hypothetical protein